MFGTANRKAEMSKSWLCRIMQSTWQDGQEGAQLCKTNLTNRKGSKTGRPGTGMVLKRGGWIAGYFNSFEKGKMWL